MSALAPKPVGRYPHFRKVGPFLFLSGIGPRQGGTDDIAQDFEAQCHSVFKNVQIVLAEAGAKLTDLVDVTVFLTNMKKDFTTYNRIWSEYIKEPTVCRTTVEVTALPTPISIELKCLAYLGEGRQEP